MCYTGDWPASSTRHTASRWGSAMGGRGGRGGREGWAGSRVRQGLTKSSVSTVGWQSTVDMEGEGRSMVGSMR